MQVCKVCGGTVGYVSGQLAKCQYCGSVYSLNGDTLSEVNLEEIYNEAVSLSKSEKESDQLAAINIWEAIGSYKDSGIKIQECRKIISKAKIAAEDKRLADLRQAELDEIERKKRENVEKQKKKIVYMTTAIVGVVAALGIAITTIGGSMKKSKYEEAVVLYENKKYDEALSLFEELGDYSDAGEYTINIESLIETRENAYKKGIGYFDAGMYSNAINELSPIADYSDTQEYIQKAATNLYEQAVEDYELENYSGAKEKLMIIPQNCNEYIRGNTLLTEIDEILLAQQKQDSYNRALAAYESGEYDKAQSLFVELGDFEDSKEYLETIGTSFYDQAQEFYNAGNYVECGDVLQHIDTVEEWSGYASATELLQKTTDAYQTIIRNSAKDICRSEGYTQMVKFIDESVCGILSNEDALILKDECNIKIVALQTIEPYTYGDTKLAFNDEHLKDTLGNVYTFTLWTSGNKPERSNSYYIDGEYSVLSGTIAVAVGEGKDKRGIVRIYGDDKLLWSDENITKDTLPYDIKVDISNVTSLKIEMYGSGNGMDYGLVPLFGDPMLSE